MAAGSSASVPNLTPVNRKHSMLKHRITEEEFFAPAPAAGDYASSKKALLAVIAAQQVLVSYPWGTLEFKDSEIEQSYLMCVQPQNISFALTLDVYSVALRAISLAMWPKSKLSVLQRCILPPHLTY